MTTFSSLSTDFIQSNPAPKVTVCVVTYNQKDFIAQCLQSLVDQITDFPFEILVGDDCSTDGTSEIVDSFARKYPARIVHWRHNQNVGAYQNYILVHTQAAYRGSVYIAHVDGDDSALPGKLQAQVDVLDRDSRISLSAHAVRVMGRGGGIGDGLNLPGRADLNDLLCFGAYFVNSSTMYRAKNHIMREPGQEIVDFYLYVEQTGFGEIHLNKNILGEYRWHDSGISKSEAHRDRIEKAYLAAFELATKMGANVKAVERSRLKRRMSFAIAALVDGRDDKFHEKIQLTNSEWLNASMAHRILSSGRHFVRGWVKDYLIRKFTGA